MDVKALEAAKAALVRTEEALALLSTQPLVSFLDPKVGTASIWSDLLVHGNRVFTKLEQGTKFGSSKGWFDKQKHKRKVDPILSYMLHARNADEHGIQLVYNLDHAHMAVEMPVGLPAGVPIINFVHDEDGMIAGAVSTDPRVRVTSQRNYEFTLREVHDRGKYYQVPIDNNGKPFEGHIVIAIAELFVAKIRDIVEEADSL